MTLVVRNREKEWWVEDTETGKVLKKVKNEPAGQQYIQQLAEREQQQFPEQTVEEPVSADDDPAPTED